MADIITVFNRLTESELVDCILFEKVLDDHYDKFKYFYFILVEMNMVDVDTISCGCDDNILTFEISCANKKDSHKYRDLFQKQFEIFNNPYYTKYFDYVITYTDYEIRIELSCLEGSENNIYESNYALL